MVCKEKIVGSLKGEKCCKPIFTSERTTFSNSRDKVTTKWYKKGGTQPTSLRMGHATSHDKAVLLPRRHQTVSSLEQESMAYADSATVPASEQHLNHSHNLKPGGTTFINVLTPAGSPWRSAPSWSLLSLQQQKARTGHRLPLTVPSPLSQQHFSISPCVGLLGVLGNVRKGRESCSEEGRPEYQEKHVITPSNTLLQKQSASLSFLPPHFPTNPSHPRSTMGQGEEGK